MRSQPEELRTADGRTDVIKVLPAAPEGLFWSAEVRHAGDSAVVALVRGPRDEVVISRESFVEDLAVSPEGGTLCVAGRGVAVHRYPAAGGPATCSREEPAHRVAFLAGGDLLAVIGPDSSWLQVWRVAAGMPEAAAIDLPAEASCLDTRGDRLAVGLQSGAVISLRLRGVGPPGRVTEGS